MVDSRLRVRNVLMSLEDLIITENNKVIKDY